MQPECKGRSALFPGGGMRRDGSASREWRGRAPPRRCQGDETKQDTPAP